MAKAKKKKASARKTAKRKAVKRRVVKRKIIRRKPAAKKQARKKPAAKARRAPKVKENVIGVVTHYFPKVRAAVIKLKAPISVGDTIKIKGHTTDFQQVVTSMQVDHVPVNQAKKGQEIGLLADSRVRQHDTVCKV